MFYRHQNDGIRLRFAELFLNVTYSIAIICDPIREKIFKVVGWHHDHSNIDVAVLKVVPDMYYIAR